MKFRRWGNPLTFGGDIKYYYWIQQHPEMVAAIRNYGMFDFGRLWIGTLYYATGIPYLWGGEDGRGWRTIRWDKECATLRDFLRTYVAGIEAPPFLRCLLTRL